MDLRNISFFVVAGPTASGKSEIAAALAERCGGEIVGADAFQIYKGLDLLTAKPSADLRARVPHHLIGEIPLTQPFDAGQYLSKATQRMSEARARGAIPIVTGGTGLYLRALTRGLADLPPANPELRTALTQCSLRELQEQYSVLDPDGFPRIDANNPRRLVRAIEVSLLTGRPFSSFREQWNRPPVPFQGLVCTRPREQLYARIDERTERMFLAGVEDEVRQCGPVGPTASQMLGFKEIQGLLRGEIDRSACISAIQQATKRYAKRQITWLRRETGLAPLELSADADPAEVARQLRISKKPGGLQRN